MDNHLSSGIGERVLIVEDDPATRTGLAELVQNWGFQTDEAADGEEALRRVTSFRPAIIVQRPGDAADGRSRPAQDAEGSAVRSDLHPADRAGHRRERRRGHQGRRLRLSEQARRSAAAEDPAAEIGRAPGNAQGGPQPSAAASRAGQLRADRRQQRGHQGCLPHHRAGGAHRGVGADLGRIGHRQGAGRADDP